MVNHNITIIYTPYYKREQSVEFNDSIVLIMAMVYLIPVTSSPLTTYNIITSILLYLHIRNYHK